jgi:uncharacterized membrane protein
MSEVNLQDDPITGRQSAVRRPGEAASAGFSRRSSTPSPELGGPTGPSVSAMARIDGRGLGWFSIGLGLSQLAAPRALARTIGVPDDARTCLLMRALGARELLAGLGILGRERKAPWLWARVAGDVMDLALLARCLTAPAISLGPRRRVPRVPIAMAAVAGVTALDIVAGRRVSRKERGVAGSTETVEASSFTTINRPPADVYAFWRDFQNFPQFMTNVQAVELRGPLRSRWTVRAPVGAKTFQWDAVITDDRANELIAWRSLAGADIASSGEVRFARAPGDQGTEVRVKLRFEQPVKIFGAATVAKLAAEQQLSQDLQRFKQVLEIGEVMLSDASIHRGPHPARPAPLSR